jgi:lipopolysaccharide transport system permease protein
MTDIASGMRAKALASDRSSQVRLALADVAEALGMSWFWMALGWNDILQRYRGSMLGPCWLTITSAAFIAGLGPLYAQLFHLNMAEYFPYLAYGFIVWNFINATINEACTTYITAGETMKQIRLPRFVPLFQLIWRNIIVFLHNLPIFVVVMFVFAPPFHTSMLAVIPGFIIVVLNLLWISLILAMVCLRFRDVAPIVASVMQIAFFLTPVMWHYGDRSINPLFIELNPFAAFVELIRLPLLGQPMNMALVEMALGCLVVGYALAALIFIRYRKQVIYWL